MDFYFFFKKNPSFQKKAKQTHCDNINKQLSEAASLLQAHRPWKAHISHVSNPCIRGNERSRHQKKIKLCSEKTNYFPYLKVCKIKHYKEKCHLSVTCCSNRLMPQTETAREIFVEQTRSVRRPQTSVSSACLVTLS